MDNLWSLFAAAASIFTAIYFTCNQIFKMNGMLVMVYRGFLVAIIMLPIAFAFPPIKEPFYYVFCILQGGLIAFNDNRFIRAAKAFGAEVTSIIQPLSVGITFVFWLFFKPSTIGEYLKTPLASTGIILCLAGITYTVIKIKKSKASKTALLYLMPVLFLLALGDIFNKKAMYHGRENLTSAILYYAVITGIVCGICNLCLYIKKKKKISAIFTKKNLLIGALFSIAVIIVMAFKNLAMHYAKNPAYASAIILISPIWIIVGNNLYIKIKGKKTGYSHVKPWLAILLLVSIIGLVTLNR